MGEVEEETNYRALNCIKAREGKQKKYLERLKNKTIEEVKEEDDENFLKKMDELDYLKKQYQKELRILEKEAEVNKYKQKLETLKASLYKPSPPQYNNFFRN